MLVLQEDRNQVGARCHTNHLLTRLTRCITKSLNSVRSCSAGADPHDAYEGPIALSDHMCFGSNEESEHP
jgi:hypothetical protein